MVISNGYRFGLIVLTFFAVMGSFSCIVWYAAVTQRIPENIPLIKAPYGPARVAPEFPGGMQVPHQNMTVFETFQESPDLENPTALRGKRYEDSKTTNHIESNISVVEGLEDNVPQGVIDGTKAILKTDVFAIQLGSFGSSEGARNGWDFIKHVHGDIMANLIPVVEVADLGDVGIFYRLRTEAIGSRQAAENLCDILRASNSDCLVVRP